MPLYEFSCNACHKEFETIVRSFSEADTVTCQYCGSSDVRRVPSTVNTKVKKTVSFPSAAPSCGSKSGFS